MIRYLSLCSGIEAFSCAVKDMPEFQPYAFSEIEPFPCKVLQHHYPLVPNLGDMTKIDGSIYHGAIQLVVGGTPCQGFSVAGKRGGLADNRSGLALKFIELVSDIAPRWILFENVPGMQSTTGGRDFGAFLEALDKCGYGLAWRILNAEYFGVPQRRRRVFMVGYSGNVTPAAKVLFEREGMCGDFAPRTEKGLETAGAPGKQSAGATTYQCQAISVYKASNVASTCAARDYKSPRDLVVDCGGVRKLTPLEYERLFGFPDNYTDVPAATDAARYKALGNSMCVNVMRWIAKRMLQVDNQLSRSR